MECSMMAKLTAKMVAVGGGSLICFVLGVMGGNAFAKSEYVLTGGGSPGYTRTQFAGLVTMTALLPASVCLLYTFLLLLRHQQSKGLRAVVHLLVLVLSVLSAYGAWVHWAAGEVLRCGVVGCIGKQLPSQIQTGLFPAVGTAGFAAAVATALIQLVLLKSAVQNKRTLSQKLLPTTAIAFLPIPASRPTTSARAKYAAAAFFLFVLPAFFLLCTFLPNGWMAFTASGIANSARQTSSTSNLPEYPSAWFKTMQWRVSADLTFTVYPDVWIFYIYLAVLGFGGVVSFCSGKARRLLRSPLRSKAPGGLTIGGVFWVVVSGVAFICWVRYWRYDHLYHRGEPKSSTEKWARTFGQVGNLLLGLLTLPVSRHSVWNTLYGVSWEQLTQYHIILGYSFLVTVLAHMCCYFKVFDHYGFFPHDVFNVPTLYPCNTWASDPASCVGGDNWTIPLAQLAALVLLVCMGVLSYSYFRRQHFELFYFAHHAAILFVFPAVLIHATSAWYFVTVGLGLWMVDRLLRFLGAATNEATVVTSLVHYEARVTRLVLKVLTPSGPFCHQPGQFAMLNFPCIAPFEWHPFTIVSASNPNNNGLVSFCIKDMGPGSFSHRLYNATANVKTRPTVVGLDGPYGALFGLQAYDAVVFVVGGIGVTPAASLLSAHFGTSYGADHGHTSPGYVKLVWSARTLDLLSAVPSVLEIALSRPSNFEMSLHLTCPPRGEGASGSLSLQAACNQGGPSLSLLAGLGPSLHRGRPDLRAQLAPLVSYIQRGDRVCVFACGPESMVSQAEKMAGEIGAEFHAETFIL